MTEHTHTDSTQPQVIRFQELSSFLLSCPICWHIIIHSSLLFFSVFQVIYLFWLHCALTAVHGPSLVAARGGCSSAVVCGLLTAGASLGLWARRLQLLRCMGSAALWHVDSSEPGIKPVSAAMVGRVLTTGPPGQSHSSLLRSSVFLWYHCHIFSFHF